MSDTIQIQDVEPVRETDKALLVEVDGEQKWCPKSVIDDDSEVYSMKSGGGTLVVQRWWAEKEGLT